MFDGINRIGRKIWKNRRDFRSILKSLYFNFHYLPFKQACHLPILFYKPTFKELKGRVTLLGGAKYGMVRLGFPTVSIYPNNGIMFENRGGLLQFNGFCDIGNNSFISIGKKGRCELGNRFVATASWRLICFHNIQIDECCCFGWDCMVMDTDFHKLQKQTGGFTKGYSKIVLGKNNWFGNGCLVMKKSVTPDYCVISARSILSEKLNIPPYSVVGQKREVEIRVSGMWRNFDDDKISYV